MQKWAWIGVFLVGCAGYSSAYDGAARIAEVQCERAFFCEGTYPDDAAVSHEDRYGADQDACASRLGPDPASEDRWQAAEESGELTYSKQAAKDCSAAVSSLDCGALWSEGSPAACEDAVEGTLALDAACRIDAVCASGLCQLGRCAGNPE